MISISRLTCGSQNFGDSLRYSSGSSGQLNGAVLGMGPVVVWNMTRNCNLNCIHCYSESGGKSFQDEMTTQEAKHFIDDLAGFNVPVLLFSGGEPLMRKDFFDLARHATHRGIRLTISTNGTLIDKSTAKSIKETGVGYVGVSLDGIGERNDAFRGRKGAFEEALGGIRNCLEIGQRVGLRFTINKHNFDQLDDIFYLVEQERIPRICFYHLVYSGRGSAMLDQDLSHAQTREALDFIISRTMELHKKGKYVEVLTVDNHCDGVYLYLKMLRENLPGAQEARRLLAINGGNRSGIAIGQVDWAGNVHPDQFTMNHTLGNVKQKSFEDIWTDTGNEIMAGLKNRKPLLKGRCSACRWISMCNGNFRPRAEAVYDDFWQEDPACYLTDEEIALETVTGKGEVQQ